MRALGEELRRLRGDRSLREVAKETKVSNAYISQIENGKIDEPSPHILHKLANYYGVPYAFLMEAAGYLRPSHHPKNGNQQESGVGGLEAALMSEELTEAEAKEVKNFIHFLRLKRSSDAG
jgi:transcriptional regulator with XRE-family HTH domain